MPNQIVLASNNAKKCIELQMILNKQNIKLLPQNTLNIPSIAETGLTFVENAIIKARHACQYSGLPAIADDSGLEVFFLNGEPGIYSARYAGEKATDQENNEKLLNKLIDVDDEQRQARFVCIIVFMRHHRDPTPIICQGFWQGKILKQAQGTHGFGYDPIFYVPEYQCSAAELPQEIKNQISHRAQALHELYKINQ